MKKLILVGLIMLFVGSYSFAQGESNMNGYWKVYIDYNVNGKLDADIKKMTPGFIIFQQSGSKIWSKKSSAPSMQFSGEIVNQIYKGKKIGKAIVHYSQINTKGQLAGVFAGVFIDSKTIVGTWYNTAGQKGDAKLIFVK